MLRHQHRISLDLALFSFHPFSFSRLAQKARRLFHVEKEERFEDNIHLFIEGTKVSFIHFPFSNIHPVEKFHGVKLASDYDIFLNKIYAAGRRIDPKDPFDAAFLYQKYRWDRAKIKEDFERKFPGYSYELSLGALLHFEDYPPLPEESKKVLLHLVKR